MPKLDRYQSPDVYEALAGAYEMGVLRCIKAGMEAA